MRNKKRTQNRWFGERSPHLKVSKVIFYLLMQLNPNPLFHPTSWLLVTTYTTPQNCANVWLTIQPWPSRVRVRSMGTCSCGIQLWLVMALLFWETFQKSFPYLTKDLNQYNTMQIHLGLFSDIFCCVGVINTHVNTYLRVILSLTMTNPEMRTDRDRLENFEIAFCLNGDFISKEFTRKVSPNEDSKTKARIWKWIKSFASF